MTARRPIHLKRGASVLIDAAPGAQLEVERFESGAVILRNLSTGRILRQWSPKEANHRA